VLYGVSNNDRRWWRNDHAPHVAYAPRDNAEYIAAAMLRDGDTRDPEDPALKYQGGPFVAEGYVKR
jgi:uronate dehydrogenase